MIHIRAYLEPGVTRIEVVGHEGGDTSGQEGRICAAVSAITQTALLGLEHMAAAYPDLVQVEITPPPEEHIS